ncbi:phosphatidate cytidylyltransferase [Amaricoccus solimangrovi]|uniref:Phosphatidate cytidylyltransferase n=1 Tax=Amaricoccus solimangrovi TaxID=2589815 RepID=A0A501WVW0_9RHOB|nr:phosphatidate cytidylyltransferase [Amaricoccus solimangrovi]TPE53558.1 phosphatidate cytidylyltransferase [Amaricoccus solimangrovi]
MRDAPPKPVRFGDLGLRLVSGLALAAIAATDIWLGGLWSAALLAAILVVMLWELDRMVMAGMPARPAVFPAMAACAALAVFVTYMRGPLPGVALILLGCAVAAAFGGRRRGWLVGGLLYMGLAVCAMVPLRHLEPNGLFFVIWLIVVVVATDVGAYFVGRLVGGPRLWPAVSPGKTRSGALGGLGFATLVGVPIGLWAGQDVFTAAFLSVGVSIASQCGDLLESAVKRRFGVKDASHIIPGHGGVMDRLDGVIGGVWFVAICGLLGLGSLG